MGWLDGIFRGEKAAAPAAPAGKTKTSGETSFEQAVAADSVLSQVLAGQRTLTLVGNRTQLDLIDRQLSSLGYLGELQAKLTSFQAFVGLSDGQGQVIGQRTLQALVAAARAGNRWKEAVAGRAIMTAAPQADRQTAQALGQEFRGRETARAIYDTSDGRPNPRIESKAYALEDSAQPTSSVPLSQASLVRAYILLGVMREGESLVTGNYRFQVLSGANLDPGKKQLFGAATYDKLLSALDAVAQGRPWLPADTAALIERANNF